MSSKPIKILLIDDDEDEYVLVRDLLAEVPDQRFDLRWAGTWGSAVAECRRGTHDVYLVDYRLGGRSGLDLLRDELDCGRRAPAIILTGQGTREIDVEAMKAGAAGYLQKGDLKPSDLERAIRYAIERHAAPRQAAAGPAVRGRVLGFLGAKGGVGTTTLVVNLAAAAARRGQQAVAIDCGSFSSALASFLKLSVSADLGELLAMTPEEIDPAQIEKRLQRHPSGVRVLASPAAPAAVLPMAVDTAAAIVAAAARVGEVVLLDLAGPPTPATLGLAQRCDFVGIVLEREPASLAAAKRVVTLLQSSSLRGTLGAIAIDRVQYAVPVPLSSVATELACSVYGMLPAAPDVCNAALRAGTPVVLAAPEHELAQAYADIAERLTAPQLKALPF